MTTTTSSSSPHVAIAGGGPSGLVAAIMLAQRGISTTVIERSPSIDPWSTKSYSIVLGDRGLNALEKANCLDAAREAGMKRNFIIMHKADGTTTVIPKRAKESLGFSRPILVDCLETIAKAQSNITILRGSGVKSITESENDTMVEVELENGTTIEATHVVGADGKWSRVRASLPDTFASEIHTEPSFGVHVMVPKVPENWREDGTHVIKPRDECKFYIIAAPIPSGELSVSVICYDETLADYPWLAPPDNDSTNTDTSGWENEYSARPASAESDTTLMENLTRLLETELPSFLDDIGKESLSTARINRRVSWVELKAPTNGNGEISFATANGRVALIGDAAHAVTPSQGEGCNLAVESAVSLINCIPSSGEEISVDDLSKAFVKYGKSRPMETEPIQQKSAVACRYATRIGA